MQEITQKLHKKVMDEFRPVAEELASNGYDSDFIVKTFKKQLDLKVKQFYSVKTLAPISEMFKDLRGFVSKQSADSKVERIFFDMLIECGLKFQFQYTIGPYRADYLFSGFLVVELDGPMHEKDHDDRRDKYMRGMGYKILRVPTWILVSCPDAVIDEIKEAIKGVRLIPNNRRK